MGKKTVERIAECPDAYRNSTPTTRGPPRAAYHPQAVQAPGLPCFQGAGGPDSARLREDVVLMVQIRAGGAFATGARRRGST